MNALNGPPPPVPTPLPVRPIAGYGADAAVAAVLAVIFLFLGMPFVRWAVATLTHQPFDTGVTWSAGDRAGMSVSYFDLEGGAAWRDAGDCATAAVFAFEAGLCLLATVRPAVAPAAFRLVIALGVLGVAANAVAAGLQIRAGFNEPLLAVVGGGLCVFTIVAATQRLRDCRPFGA